MKITPPKHPRLEPCAQVNPSLWYYFCQLKNRPANPSDVWTEFDVVQHLNQLCAKDLQNGKKENGQQY